MSWIRQRILKGDKGLGDTLERFTKATGIKNVVEKVSEFTGKDCGCKKRKNFLNKIFSYDTLETEQQNQLNKLITAEHNKDFQTMKLDKETSGFTRITDENIDAEIEKMNALVTKAKNRMGY